MIKRAFCIIGLLIFWCNASCANEELDRLYYQFSTQKLPLLFDAVEDSLVRHPEIYQDARVRNLAVVTKDAYKTWYQKLDTLAPDQLDGAARLIKENLSLAYFEDKVDLFLSSKSRMISWEIPLHQQIIDIMIGVWGAIFFENRELAEIRHEFYHLFTCDDHDCTSTAEEFLARDDEHSQTLAVQKYFECKREKDQLYGPHLAELCELINNDNFASVIYYA